MLQLERAKFKELRAKTSPDCAKNQMSFLSIFSFFLSDILKTKYFLTLIL